MVKYDRKAVNVITNQEKGLEFEKRCFMKLVDLGFSDLSLTKHIDNGADIIGTLNGTRYVFQCKNHKKSQGNGCVQEIIAAQSLYNGNRSVVISYSPFTTSAIALAKANNCILIQSSEFFKLTEFPPKGYTDIFGKNTLAYDFKYQLVERYEERKKELNRTPKWGELDANLRYLITKNYKNYGNFLTLIGDMKYASKHTSEELKNEYMRIRKLLGKTPTGGDIREMSTFPYNQFHEYPLTKLQRECGDRPNIERGVTKEELTLAYYELERRLGHPPAIKEIDEMGKYRSSYYNKRWGNFDGFLMEIGRTRTEAGLPRVYTKDEIISIYSLIKVLFSIINECDDYKVNQTTLEKLRYNGRSLISSSTYTTSNKFGNWNSFMELLKEKGINKKLAKITNKIRINGIDALFELLDE